MNGLSCVGTAAALLGLVIGCGGVDTAQNDDEPVPATVQEASTLACGQDWRTVASNVLVRAKPQRDGNRLGQIAHAGTNLTGACKDPVHRDGMNWIAIKYSPAPNNVGWVARNLVTPR